MKRHIRVFVHVVLIFALAAACVSAGADGALFEAAVSLQSGAEPTRFSVWPSSEHAEGFPDDPALLAQVAPPAGEVYTFLFPSYESGGAGLVAPLRFTDINGDGYLDVEAVFALGASNLSCTYFLYDAADGRVRYSAELGALSNAAYDAERNIILSQTSDGAATQTYTLFTIEAGVPALARMASMDASAQGDAYVLRTTVIAALTGERLLSESVPFADDEAAVWNAQYEKMMRALLDGYESHAEPDAP